MISTTRLETQQMYTNIARVVSNNKLRSGRAGCADWACEKKAATSRHTRDRRFLVASDLEHFESANRADRSAQLIASVGTT